MDKFKWQVIHLDNANTRIVKRYYASNNDQNGRGLKVFIRDGDEQANISNVDVYLTFERPDGFKGSKKAKKVNLDTGEFDIVFPTSMLREVGDVACTLRVEDKSNITHTLNFCVEVYDAHDTTSIAPDDLTEAQEIIKQLRNGRAKDSELLAGLRPAWINTENTLVQRSNSDEKSIKVGVIYQNDKKLDDTYLGKEDKAVDSERVDGRLISYEVEASQVPRWSKNGNLKAARFNESGEWLEDKYLGINGTAKDSEKVDGRKVTWGNEEGTIVRRSDTDNKSIQVGNIYQNEKLLDDTYVTKEEFEELKKKLNL